MRVLVTGARGQLGRDLMDALSGAVPVGGLHDDVRTGRLGTRGPLEVRGTDLPDLDITDRQAVLDLVDQQEPQVIVHGAAFTAVDACESDPDRAFAVNAMATRHLVEAARRVHAHLVYISTDYVFDGTLPRPYMEWDHPNPRSVYGRSKHAGELEVGPADTVVRTSWVCGAHGANMVKTVLALAERPGPLRFVDDQHGSPTFTADLAGMVMTLGCERRPGRFHVTNQGSTSWYGFAQAVLEASGDDPTRVEPITSAQLDPPRPAPRPANSVLDNAALRLSNMALLPPWEDGLRRLVGALRAGAAGGAGAPAGAGGGAGGERP